MLMIKSRAFLKRKHLIFNSSMMTWKPFLLYWPYMRGIHQSLVDSPHKGTVLWSFDVSWVLSLNKLLNKKSICHWFGTPCLLYDFYCIFFYLFLDILYGIIGIESPLVLIMAWYQIDGLVLKRCNSIANALELRLSCTNPSK